MVMVLRLHLQSAKHLPKTDGLLGKIDPYCVATLGTDKRQTTATLGNEGPNPKFNTTLRFPYANETFLLVELFDHDFFRSADDELGRVILNVVPNLSLHDTYQLRSSGSKAKKSGTLKLSLDFEETSWPNPSLRLLKHDTWWVGFLRVFEGEVVKPFKTYEVDLQYVRQVFSEHEQGWNKQYDAAKNIFDDGHEMMRNSVMAGSLALYSNSSLKTKQKCITSGRQLLELLKFGVRNTSRLSRMYTFVVTDDRLCFSETGKRPICDIVSKHAVHSGASFSVRYSGEFMFSKDENDDWVWVLDNNSGTYSPDPKDLPLLQAAMEKNFPDVRIECLAFDDPRHKAYLDKLKFKK